MTKGCYTCRRRRIICDNGQPTCRKCRDAGKECLGYQKPLVWVKGGVASRGKMMGRSFEDKEKQSQKPQQQSSQTATAQGSSSSYNSDPLPASGSSPDTISPNSNAQQSPETYDWAQDTLEPLDFGQVEPTQVDVPPETFPETDNQVIHVPRNYTPDYIPAPWGLVDPIMHDLNPLTRFYLSHCTLSASFQSSIH